MWAPTMLKPFSRGSAPMMYSWMALFMVFTYTLSPACRASTLSRSAYPAFSARRMVSRTHSRSVLPLSKKAR